MQQQEGTSGDARGAGPAKQALEPEVDSQQAADFMRRMHRECRGYDVASADGQRRLRAFLEQFSREERQRMAYRIMTDLMSGPSPARSGAAPQEPEQQGPAEKR